MNNEFKGTKGEWKAGKTFRATKDGCIRAMVTAHDPDANICVCDGLNGTEPSSQAEANAKLIAAAPDMLLALELVSELLDDQFQTSASINITTPSPATKSGWEVLPQPNVLAYKIIYAAIRKALD